SKFVQLTSGFGALVVAGKIIPDKAPLHAPRTIIGTYKDGRMILLVIDGVETEKVGPTNLDAAEWVQPLGIYHAINLDGGGSSVLNYPYDKYYSAPHCHNTWEICERAVTTIMCITK